MRLHRLLTSLLFLGSLQAFAKTPKAAAPAPPPPAPRKTLEQRAQEMTDAFARQIDNTAESIDIMLAGKKYTKKANTSNIRISQFVTHSEGGLTRLSTDFGLNLRLPNVERRWQLRFTSYNEEEENRDLTQQRVRTRPRERDYGAGLMFFEKLGKIRTMFQPRLQLKNPLEISYITRFESEAKVGAVRLMPRLDLFADPVKGTGQFFSLGFAYDLAPRWVLELQNTEEYRERGNFFVTQHEIAVDYALKSDEALGAAITAVSHNRAHYHLEDLTASTTFTHQFSPDRFALSLSPFVTFAHAVHFKGNIGVTLNLVLTL
jgi:hypothetical protein